ncbi:MAG TPA: Rrf2 family transcriptional regulator [Candidatus Cybelea sp.]|nr:Rrf2 family transcriptional regulator [Candidatus Cybelea sp.]
MLSQKAKYAMRALLYLARAEPNRPVLISDIADQQSVPKKFLELILLDLKRHGLVHSYRGKKGGYLLAKDPHQIFFGQVIRIIDGPLAQLPCASRTAYRRCDDCQDERTCEIRKVLMQVRDSTARILDNTSLADVMSDIPGGAARELAAGAGI